MSEAIEKYEKISDKQIYIKKLIREHILAAKIKFLLSYRFALFELISK